LAEYHTDLGPAKKFKGITRINIPGYFEETVDSLKFIADEMRGEKHKVDYMDLLQLDKVNLG